MRLIVTGPTQTAEAELTTNGSGTINFAVQPTAKGQTIVELCDADGCVYGRASIDVAAAPITTAAPPPIAVSTTTTAAGDAGVSLLALWGQSSGVAIDRADVVPIDMFTGARFDGPLPAPDLIPSDVGMLQISGEPTELLALIDCGGIAVCTPQFTGNDLAEVQVFGVSFSGNLPVPPRLRLASTSASTPIRRPPDARSRVPRLRPTAPSRAACSTVSRWARRRSSTVRESLSRSPRRSRSFSLQAVRC